MSAPVLQFKSDAQRVAGDLHHREIIQTAMRNYEVVRDQRKRQFQDWEGARELARRTKSDAIAIPAVKAARFFQIDNQLSMALDLQVAAALPLIK